MKCILEALGNEKNGPSQISGWTNRMNGGDIHWKKRRFTEYKVRLEFLGVK